LQGLGILAERGVTREGPVLSPKEAARLELTSAYEDYLPRLMILEKYLPTTEEVSQMRRHGLVARRSSGRHAVAGSGR
jgi:hypothetical protein